MVLSGSPGLALPAGVLGPLWAPGLLQNHLQMPALAPELQMQLVLILPAALEQLLEVDSLQDLQVLLILHLQLALRMHRS